ncbi:MAG: hypothetical protein HQM13_22105 [SAR324 cluster bacterium]|nr:hypothetical protein [SAR324 cluster bacterium]
MSRNFSFFQKLSEVRKMVLIDMCFNLGLSRLKKFKTTLAAIETGDFVTASREMLNSRRAKQVGTRAERLSEKMKSHIFPENLFQS